MGGRVPAKFDGGVSENEQAAEWMEDGVIQRVLEGGSGGRKGGGEDAFEGVLFGDFPSRMVLLTGHPVI